MNNKLIIELIQDFRAWETGTGEGLTHMQCEILLEAEEHEVFMFDQSLYQSIMDYRDHLELESDLDGYYENSRIQAYND